MKYLGYALVILMFIFLFTLALFAECPGGYIHVPVQARVVRAPNTNHKSIVKTAIARMNKEMLPLCIRVRAQRIMLVAKDPCGTAPYHVDGINLRYACYRTYSMYRNLLRKERILSWVVPPAIGYNEIWSYGFASATCYGSGPMTISTNAMLNARGESRVEHSQIALIHELGHIIGARHNDDYCNTMHPDALRCVSQGGGLKFDSESLNQITKCVYGRYDYE